MKAFAARRPVFGGPALALVFAGLTVGCTHEYQITPTFQKSLAGLPQRRVCAQGESIQVAVVHESPAPLEAGRVQAGIHTFKHQFDRDPALALQEGLTAALRDVGCATSGPSTTSLRVELVSMEAHGQACGFTSCDGTAAANVSVTLKDATGEVLSREHISTAANDDCGMTFCSEEETSRLATQALSEAVGKAVLAIGAGLSKRPVVVPLAAAPQPGT